MSQVQLEREGRAGEVTSQCVKYCTSITIKASIIKRFRNAVFHLTIRQFYIRILRGDIHNHRHCYKLLPQPLHFSTLSFKAKLINHTSARYRCVLIRAQPREFSASYPNVT